MIKTRQDMITVQERYGQALQRAKARFVVCAGPGCVASGSLQVYEALVQELKERNLHTTVDCLLEAEGQRDGVITVNSGCQGFCQLGPLVRVEPEGILYTKVKADGDDVREIVDAMEAHTVVTHLCYHDPRTHAIMPTEQEIPFYKHQTRVALANCGIVDPEDIRSYMQRGGYQGLATALELAPEEVLGKILQANLRGRGGGGFPAGRKWAIAAAQKTDHKYMICNGDEGDPGAFMDRSIASSRAC